MATSGLFKNPILLYNLLRKDIRDAMDKQVILTEDLYYRGVLIVKAGSFLDEETIYKLLNFGFKRVNVLLPDDKELGSLPQKLSLAQLKKQYLAGQKCVIADKDGHFINQLVSMVKASYLKEENILAFNNSIPLKNAIEEHQPKYIFIDLNLYPHHGLKVIKDIRNYSNAHIFLTALVDKSKIYLCHKLRNEVQTYNATLLLKPVSSVQLRMLLMDSVSSKDVRNYLTLKRYLKDKFKSA